MRNKYYPDNLHSINLSRRTSFHALIFSISLLKRNLKTKEWNFWEKNVAIFHDVKKMEIYFLYNSFVSYICYQGNFFQEHRHGIKNIVRNIWRIF